MREFLVLPAIIALVTGAAVAPAHAILISTEGSLNGGLVSSHPSYTMWPGSGLLEFIGLKNVTVDTGVGTLSLGSLKVSGTYGATSKTTPNLPLPFTIQINGGSDTLSGFLSGSFGTFSGSDWSALKITITDNVTAVDGFVYTVSPISSLLYRDQPVSVIASYTGTSTGNPVVTPEPSTLLLVGTALGLTGLVRSVRSKTSRRKL